VIGCSLVFVKIQQDMVSVTVKNARTSWITKSARIRKSRALAFLDAAINNGENYDLVNCGCGPNCTFMTVRFLDFDSDFGFSRGHHKSFFEMVMSAIIDDDSRRMRS
jgi:hypothetical protein